MGRKIRIIAIIAGVIIVVLVVLPFVIPVNDFRPTIEEKLSAALGRKVQVGNLSLSLLSGSLSAEDLSIADDPKFSASPFLTAKSLQVGVELIPLIFSHSLHITGITINGPQVTLLRDAGERWNFSSLGVTSSKTPPSSAKSSSTAASGSTTDFQVQKFVLKDGRIIIGKAGSSRRSTYDHVNVEASDVSATSAFPVTVNASLPGGGSLTLSGHAGPVNENDAALTPLDAKITVKGLDLASAGVLDPAFGLAGQMDLDGSVTSKNGEAETKGDAKLSKLLLVAGGSPSKEPAALEFSTRSDLRREAGVLNPSTVRIGNAVAHVSGTYASRGEETHVNLKFTAQDVPARDLEAFLPAVGVNLPHGASLTAGTLSANLTIQGPTNHLVTTGTVGLAKGRLSGFDLGRNMSAIGALAGIKTGSDLDIEKMTTNLRMAPDGLRADNFNAFLPALGSLNGAGTVDAKNNLDFKMLATLSGGASGGSQQRGVAGMLGGMLGGAKGGGQGTGIPFLIQGTTSNPKFVPDVSGMVRGFLKSQLSGAGGQQNPNTQQQKDNDPFGLGDLFKKKPNP
jgi:AsmA protein